MASAKKIIEQLGPVDMKIYDIGDEIDMLGKNGAYRAHKVILKSASTGDTIEDKLFPNQVDSYKVGDVVQLYLNDKGYVAFRKIQSGEPRNNYQEVKKERAMQPINARIDNLQRTKEIQICLQGLYQAHISAGKDNNEALKLAAEARNLLQLEVAMIMSKESASQDPHFG
jgi:uncharacterized membrane protein